MKPVSKKTTYKGFSILISRQLDKDNYPVTIIVIEQLSNKQLVINEESTVINPLPDLINNYKDKIDLFLAAGKIPKAKKKIQKVEEDKSELVDIILSVIEKLSIEDKNKISKFLNNAAPKSVVKKNLKEEVPILPKKRGRPKKCV